MKTTVICHIYNEEYLLPFWLTHHKKFFDHGIIIDYHSTDNSLTIIKKICPEWSIRTSRNKMFCAVEVDNEVMEIESSIDGIKMVLNVTEFIFSINPLSSLFNNKNKNCYGLEAKTPVSQLKYDDDPLNLSDLIDGISSVRWIPGQRLGHRFIHNYPTGQYSVGRHSTSLPFDNLPDCALIWLGFYPWNNAMIDRKLQIMSKIPESDVINHFEILKQHTMDLEALENKRNELQKL
jgi:hypothetical protein